MLKGLAILLVGFPMLVMTKWMLRLTPDETLPYMATTFIFLLVFGFIGGVIFAKEIDKWLENRKQPK